MCGGDTLYVIAQKNDDNNYWVHWLSDGRGNILKPRYFSTKRNELKSKILWLKISVVLFSFFLAVSVYCSEYFSLLYFCAPIVLALLGLLLANCSYLKALTNNKTIELESMIESVCIDLFLEPKAQHTTKNINTIMTNLPINLALLEAVLQVTSVVLYERTYQHVESDYVSVSMECDDFNVQFEWPRKDVDFPVLWEQLPPFISTGDEIVIIFSDEVNQIINEKRMRDQPKNYKEYIHAVYLYNKTSGQLYRSRWAGFSDIELFANLPKNYPCYTVLV